MNRPVIFNFAETTVEKGNGSVYSSYLGRYKAMLERNLLPPEAEREFTTFSRSLEDLLAQYKFVFQGATEQRRAILVLGKVQSGKTAHLLGNLAWAAGDMSVAFATLFTGTALALNNQGIERIQKDLVNLSVDGPVVLEVPTSPKSAQFEEFYQQLKALVGARMTGDGAAPLPILVTIKRPGRIRAVVEARFRLIEDFGEKAAMLLIDDETDQASQNAGANAGRNAPTYAALARLYAAGRGVMLSYTATPQAVLLTEKFGKLRPDYCHVIDPRVGYFGLEDVVSAKFSQNLYIVDDLLAKITSHKTAPDSLIRAIAGFMLVALVRANFADQFYARSKSAVNDANRMQSVQMLVHQSTVKIDHAHLKTLVDDALKTLVAELGSSDFEHSGIFAQAWVRLRSQMTETAELPESIPGDAKPELLELLRGVAIRVVNSDAKRQAPEDQFPVSDTEWESHRSWILIGGEILGRGLTIPQLCVSYFVRGSAQPKFDTVAQQMRFCGYRQDYAHVTSIFSTQSNLDLFQYMNGIERVLWRKARKWSSGRIRISGAVQPVYYASPSDTRLDPCRKAVQDPDIQDLKFGQGSELIVTLHDIFNPLQVKENIALVNELFPSATSSKTARSEYVQLEHVSENVLTDLLNSWEGSANTRSHLRAIATLFDESLGEWGLAEIPITAFVKLPKLEDYKSNAVFSELAPISRGSSQTEASASTWLEVRDLDFMPRPVTWPTLRVPHVGDGQRTLKNKITYDSSVLVIEPIRAVLPNTQTPLAWGLGLTIFRPNGFELRILGHK